MNGLDQIDWIDIGWIEYMVFYPVFFVRLRHIHRHFELVKKEKGRREKAWTGLCPFIFVLFFRDIVSYL